jgi:hypothetical protein
MSEAIIIVLFAALFVAALIAAICAAGSQTFAQKHPLMNAALKGFMFYSFLYAIYVIVQLIFPSFTSLGFVLGSLVGSVGGAVFGYRALLESQNQKPQNLKPELRENNLKTLPN